MRFCLFENLLDSYIKHKLYCTLVAVCLLFATIWLIVM